MIQLTQGDETALHEIESLWKELNAHHAALSRYSVCNFDAKVFQHRVKELVSRKRKIRVALAIDGSDKFGYCVSSAVYGDLGEIDSLYVSPSYRGCGAGKLLVNNAVEWFAQMKTKKNILSVYEGNEEAWKFYISCGFYPRETIFEMKRGN